MRRSDRIRVSLVLLLPGRGGEPCLGSRRAGCLRDGKGSRQRWLRRKARPESESSARRHGRSGESRRKKREDG